MDMQKKSAGRFGLQPGVVIESLKVRCARYLEMFEMEESMLTKLNISFHAECQQSLSHHKEPSVVARGTIPCLETCISEPPTGHEEGVRNKRVSIIGQVYLGIEFASSNLRVGLVKLEGGVNSVEVMETVDLSQISDSKYPKGLVDRNASATELFDEISKTCGRVLEVWKLKGGECGCSVGSGFVFSFPSKHLSIRSATLLNWVKGVETGRNTQDRVEVDADIGDLLQAAFRRNRVPATCLAVVNDTVATLFAGAYDRDQLPPCIIGIVYDEGLNASYYERTAREFGYQGFIINTECGMFDRDLPRNIIDHQVDLADVDPGSNRMEKMCSGRYLPEICRRGILRMFAWRAPPLAWVRHSMDLDTCIAIAFDQDDPLHHVTRQKLQSSLEWEPEDQQIVNYTQQLLNAILRRAAGLLSVTICALARQTGKLQSAAGGVAIAIHGKLYSGNSKFKKLVQKFIEETVGPQRSNLIKILVVEDAAVIGSAIIAAKLRRS